MAYEELLKKDFETIPIEFYKISWKSFARDGITTRNIPIKSALIDSSSHRYYNGSDIYISRIIKNNLNEEQKADISQAFRKLKETFMGDASIKAINEQVDKNSRISTSKKVEISVDMSTRNAWETTLMTYLDEVPFHQIGKGEQCIVKTNLSLSHKKSEEANLILLEEPENHLTHSKLNEFLKAITNNSNNKQVVISTHSSFVANKLGLENLILLNVNKELEKREKLYFNELEDTTNRYFKKLSGYDTLIDKSDNASSIILREDNGVGSLAFLISFKNNGDIIDKKKIMEAFDNGDLSGPDFDIFYELDNKTVTMNYRIMTPVSPNDNEPHKTHDIQKFTRYVRIDESGYFFELSSPEINNNSRIFPNASKRKLSKDDLDNISNDELAIMRNEIFAIHGYIFKSDRYKSYFSNKKWYTPKYDDVLDKLTDVEKANINIIKEIEGK